MKKTKTGVSYFGNRILRHAARDMSDIRNNGCNFVVHTFSETDLRFYKETMKEMVKISHKNALQVYVDPWAVGGIFGGESFSQFVSKNLDVRQISQRGESLPAACINHVKFRSFMKEWIRAAIDIGGDVIFWDEPHFFIWEENWISASEASRWSCRCEVCRKLFFAKYREKMPMRLTGEVKAFRQGSMIRFLQEMTRFVARYKKKNALCFLPRIKPIGGIENWDEVIGKLKKIDIIGTDPYWSHNTIDVYSHVYEFSAKIYDLALKHSKEPQIWILNFNIRKGTERNISKAVQAAFDSGVRNIAAWSYRGAESMSALKSDRPEEVWRVLGAAYKKIWSKQARRS